MIQDNYENEKSPLFKNWNGWYRLVIFFLAVIIIFFYLVTKKFA